jgi:hypothetical protein
MAEKIFFGKIIEVDAPCGVNSFFANSAIPSGYAVKITSSGVALADDATTKEQFLGICLGALSEPNSTLESDVQVAYRGLEITCYSEEASQAGNLAYISTGGFISPTGTIPIGVFMRNSDSIGSGKFMSYIKL